MYLGIDLGTSNSAAAGYFGGKPRVLTMDEAVKKTASGADVLPSVIYIGKRGNKLFGFRAYNQLAVSSENVAAGFKRQMGTSWTQEFPASGHVMTAEECSADILKQLVLQAESESGGEKIIGTVITVPAAFNQTQMQATARAADAAGIEKVAFLQEPIAAALAAMANAKNRDSQFLVYDLGGGTFDLALVQSVRGSVNIIAHEGDNMLGGRDFDSIIVNNIIRPWLLENFALSDDFQKSHPKLIQRANFAAETAKIELSARREAIIFASEDDLRVTDDNGGDVYVDIPVSRKDYEPLIADEVARTVALSRKILKDNGFEPGDIDKIVFIGGPCKTPFIRETVSRELGVPANMDIDPMTAVALGAAIDCETRDWSGKPGAQGTRKNTRASERVSGPLEIQYDYPARVTDNRARVRIRLASPATAKGCEISIESATGWTSGLSALEDKAAIEIPVNEDGENIFRIWVYDSEGKPIAEAGRKIAIVRGVSSAATPTAHDLAVKIVTGEGDDARDALQSIVKKGENLPAEGVARSFLSARDIGDEFSVEFWEQPNAKNSRPESPNLFVGRCVIRADDLPEGESIQRGDEVHIHWSVNESHLIKTAVEIPRLGHVSDWRRFVSSIGSSYEGEDGRKIADDSLRDVLGEIKAAEESVKPDNPDHVTEIRQARNEAEKLRAELRHSAGDAEEHRRVVEKARGIRGRLAGVRDESADQVHELERKLNKEVNSFNEGCREDADESAVEEFDNLAEECRESLKRGESGISDARRMLERMGQIHSAVLREQPSFVIGAFKHFAQERHLALDKRQFDEDVAKGLEAIESRDFDEVREVIRRIWKNRVQTDEHPETRKFADIMRK